MSGIVSKLSNIFGFHPKTNSYGLYFAKFRLLNVLYAKVVKDRFLVTFVLNWIDVWLKSWIKI